MKVPSNRFQTVFNFYLTQLQENFDLSESRALLRLLFASKLNIDKSRIPDFYSDNRLSESELLLVHFGVKELKFGKPIEYVTGEVEFHGNKFFVDENVLIPRPETEELVELVKKDFSGKANPAIIDIGTGSGCIAISLSKALKSKIIAVDISLSALEVAKNNNQSNSTDVEFFNLDILNFKSHELASVKFDALVSNPPYVREQERGLMSSKVLDHEPSLALFVPDHDPLLFYDAIKKFALETLRDDGFIYLEINEFLGKQTADLFKPEFENIQLIQDLFGKDRFLKVGW